MTDHHFELIKKAGFKEEEFLNTLHLVYMLSDVQERFLMRMERIMKVSGFYGFEDKQLIKDAILRNKKVIKIVDRVTSLEYACEFGDKCDELIEVIEEWAKKD
jgi:hypothetical protein